MAAGLIADQSEPQTACDAPLSVKNGSISKKIPGFQAISGVSP